MKGLLVFSLFLGGLFFGSGGCSGRKSVSGKPPEDLPTMVATYTPTPVVIDGKLDDPIWSKTPVYPLNLSADKVSQGLTLEEAGEVRLAWDDRYFYVAARFHDSDVVAEGKTDQLHHYKLGDLCELFLKPADQTWYWELYGTPAGRKTAFWFPGRGRLGLPSMEDYTCGLTVAAEVQGTLNDWRDRDEGWTVEIAMPIKDLTARGETFGPGADWRILVSRYNYSRYLTTQGPELSMTPQLTVSSYHLIEEYARLCLEK